MKLGTCLNCKHGHIINSGVDNSSVEYFRLFIREDHRPCKVCNCTDESRLLAAETRHGENKLWVYNMPEHELDNCPRCRRLKRRAAS